MNKQLRAKLQDYDRKALKLDKNIVALYWKGLHGEDVGRQFNEANGKKSDFTRQSGYPELLEANMGISDPRDARELKLRQDALIVDSIRSHPAAAEALESAAKAQSAFRVKVDGRELDEGEVARILNKSDDRNMREKVWRAQEQSLELAPVKQNVISSLNEATRQVCVQESFAGAVLEAQDSNPRLLTEVIIRFEEGTRGAKDAFMEEVRSFSGLPRLEPWDVPFYITGYLSSIKGDFLPRDGEHALALLRRTLGVMGFAGVHGRKYLDPESIGKPPFIFDVDSGEGYAMAECSIWAGPGAREFMVFINPERSPTGFDLTRTVFLESGHILHYQALEGLRTRLAFKYDSDCMRHALAMLFDSVTEDEKWLRDIAGLETKEAERLAGLLRMKKALMARRLAADALFETHLYTPIGVDEGALFRKVQEHFQGRKLDYEVEKRWAWHPDLAENPAGQIGYALGYMICGAIADDMRSNLGGSLLHPKAAERLVDKYYTGYEKPWKDRIPF